MRFTAFHLSILGTKMTKFQNTALFRIKGHILDYNYKRDNNLSFFFCQADDSHVMSSIISSEKYKKKHALKMSSASRDWHFKG